MTTQACGPRSRVKLVVMPGLVPGIHVLSGLSKKDVDGRDKPGHDDEKRICPSPLLSAYDGAMVSFTAATSWLSVKGFGRNANCWFSGRLFSKASSA